MMPILTMLLLPALIAAPPSASKVLVAKPGAIPRHCGPTVDKTRGPRVNGATTLGDQPPAAQVLTVYRTNADGCPTPVVLRKGIGNVPVR